MGSGLSFVSSGWGVRGDKSSLVEMLFRDPADRECRRGNGSPNILDTQLGFPPLVPVPYALAARLIGRR